MTRGIIIVWFLVYWIQATTTTTTLFFVIAEEKKNRNSSSNYYPFKPSSSALVVVPTKKETSLIASNNDDSSSSSSNKLFGYVDGFGVSRVQEITTTTTNNNKDDDLSLFTPNKFRPKGLNVAICTSTVLFGTLLSRFLNLSDNKTWRNTIIAAYVIYLLEAFFSSTRRYLSNQLSPSEFKDILHSFQREVVKPMIQWKLECYHYSRRRTRKESNSQSNKIVTHRASGTYLYKSFKNISNFQHVLDALEFNTKDHPFLMISIGVILLFSDVPDYWNQFNTFKHREGYRDTHTDIQTSLIVNQHLLAKKRKFLAVRTGISDKAHVRLTSFWICTVLGLTIPYRRWFHQHCDDIPMNVIIKILQEQYTTNNNND